MLILIYCSHNYAYDHDSCDFCNGKIDYDTTIIVKVHSSLPACHIRLTEKEFKAEHSTGIYTDWCYEIRIRKDNCKHEAQYICGKSLSSFQQKYGGGDSDIEFIDYNFDGYIDIGMYSGCSANGMNKRFDIFLFDRMKETFLYSKEFSKILSGTYYEIDPTKREIESAGESGCMGQWWSRNTYRVVNGLEEPARMEKMATATTTFCR
jgi:hypothetical protein